MGYKVVDLRANNVTDATLHDANEEHLQTQEKTLLDLSENYIGLDGLRELIRHMQCNKNIRCCVWLNRISFSELYSVLSDMDCKHYLSAGRITAENTCTGRVVEKEAAELMSSAGTLSKLSEMFHDWIGVESRSSEQEMTAAVVEHVSGLSLEVTRIYCDDGSELCEFDGVVAGIIEKKEVLVLLEAKHRVTQDHLDKEDIRHPGLKQRLEKFRTFLKSLDGNLVDSDNKKITRQRYVYKKFAIAEVVGAIGGVHFDSSLQTRARRLNFLCVTTDGTRYQVN